MAIQQDDLRLQQMRSIGWAHALHLIAEGMRQDAAVCDGEGWPICAAYLDQTADQIENLSDDVRAGLRNAEWTDQGRGAQ